MVLYYFTNEDGVYIVMAHNQISAKEYLKRRYNVEYDDLTLVKKYLVGEPIFIAHD